MPFMCCIMKDLHNYPFSVALFSPRFPHAIPAMQEKKQTTVSACRLPYRLAFTSD